MGAPVCGLRPVRALVSRFLNDAEAGDLNRLAL
jgi:hypothetical protein